MTSSPALSVAQQRLTLPRFVLAPPDVLQHGEDADHGLGDDTVRALGRIGAEVALSPLDAPGLLPKIREALALLPPGTVDASVAPDQHDAYFHLARTSDAPALSYLRCVVAALDVFLAECTDDQETSDYAVIGDALIELWLVALGMDAPARPVRMAAAMKARTQEPVRRWLRGHHVFASLTQGLIRTLYSFERVSSPQDPAAIAAHLARITRLYHASAAAFRFTADFAPEAYTDIIRPSMSEPHVPPGFSGSMSLDHGELVAYLSRLRQPLAAARALCPEAYAGMTAALALVYDDHRWVCERFAGAQGPSLRTGRVCGDKAAIDMIDRFKSRRLDMLG